MAYDDTAIPPNQGDYIRRLARDPRERRAYAENHRRNISHFLNGIPLSFGAIAAVISYDRYAKRKRP